MIQMSYILVVSQPEGLERRVREVFTGDRQGRRWWSWRS